MLSSGSSGGLAGLSSPRPHATCHPSENSLQPGTANRGQVLHQRYPLAVAGTRLMTGLRRFGRDPVPLEEGRGQTATRRLRPGWMRARSPQTICGGVRAGTSSCPSAVAERRCPGGHPQVPPSIWGSRAAPAAPSHLPRSSSPAGKGKPGISCSQHIPGIYLPGLPRRRPLLMKDTDLEQAFG